MGNWEEIVLSRARTTEDASTTEHSVQVADLAMKDSHYDDYYLLKVTDSGVISLQENFEVVVEAFIPKGKQFFLEISFKEHY